MMNRDELEITQSLASIRQEGRDLIDECVWYRPHPDYPEVRISMHGIDAAVGRLISFLGLGLPREAVYQVVAAYLAGEASAKADREGKRRAMHVSELTDDEIDAITNAEPPPEAERFNDEDDVDKN